jgi:crossover junction endodeoxyribonuclease RuvC
MGRKCTRGIIKGFDIMIILGIDPGIAIVGYGVIKYNGIKHKVIDYGAVKTMPSMDLTDRLKVIYEELSSIISLYKPDTVAIEELFFNKNVKTALTVGHGRGVALLSAANNGLNVHEYTPLQVKQAVTGYGRADKHQVQSMVKAILSLEVVPKPDDVADALAVAICHAHSAQLDNAIKYSDR